MHGPVSDFNYIGLVGETQAVAKDAVFAKTMRGVYSATITLKKFRGTEPSTDGYLFRKFIYNQKGEVVKRLSFDEDGNIEMKEESTYDEKGNLVSSRFITQDNIIREKYDYDDKGNLLKYTFANPKQPGIKYETNEIDEKGRMVKTTSFGFLKTPELVSHFIYPEGKSKRYRYKHVTKSDGSTLMTFYYTYDSEKDDSNLTGLYGFYLTPNEIDQLLQDFSRNKEWEKSSVFRSRWTYTNGKQTLFERDEQIQPFHLEYGFINEDERVVTDRSDIFYKEIEGKEYPVQIIDWQTRYMEPCKVLKEYSYSDENGVILYPPAKEDNLTQSEPSANLSVKHLPGQRKVIKKTGKSSSH